MKYFFDTEFLEGPQTVCGFWKTKPTIDLISIGIVDEGGREYYAVSKDFNLKEAWYRHDIVDGDVVYWIRDNVLLPIYLDWVHGDQRNRVDFSYYGMKTLLKEYGKSNKKIAQEIVKFVSVIDMSEQTNDYIIWMATHQVTLNKPEFYAYYADYDWVVFCWLFGRMIDLPDDFPQYCIDLKQTLDRQVDLQHMYYNRDVCGTMTYKDRPASFEEKLGKVKSFASFPKETNEHHSLADARWTKQLYEFIKKRLV